MSDSESLQSSGSQSYEPTILDKQHQQLIRTAEDRPHQLFSFQLLASLVQQSSSGYIQKQLEAIIALRKLIYAHYHEIFLKLLQSRQLAKIFEFTKQYQSPQLLLETYRIIFLVVHFAQQMGKKPFITEAFDLLVDGLESQHRVISQISLAGLLIVTSQCREYNKQLIEKGQLVERLVDQIDSCEEKKRKKICVSILANISKDCHIEDIYIFRKITKIFANAILEYKFPADKYCSVSYEILLIIQATQSLFKDSFRQQLAVSMGIIPKLMDCTHYKFIVKDALNLLAAIMDSPGKFGKELVEAGLINSIERILMDQGDQYAEPIYQMLANFAYADVELIKPLFQKEQTMEYIFHLQKSMDQQRGILNLIDKFCEISDPQTLQQFIRKSNLCFYLVKLMKKPHDLNLKALQTIWNLTQIYSGGRTETPSKFELQFTHLLNKMPNTLDSLKNSNNAQIVRLITKIVHRYTK